jgi:hypothetical protein
MHNMLNFITGKKQRAAVFPSGRFKILVFLAFMSCFAVATARQADSVVITNTARPAIQPLAADTVLSVVNLGTQGDTASLGSIVSITVRTMRETEFFTSLYVNGLLMEDVQPWKRGVRNLETHETTFFFQLPKSLRDLLAQNIDDDATDKTFVPVYLGIGSKDVLAGSSENLFYIEFRRQITEWLLYVIIVGVTVMVVLALKHHILKDDNNVYYSLGRTQLFYWTILFIGAYLSICFNTGELPDLPGSILTILGISIGTTALSKVVENKDIVQAPINPAAHSEGFFMDILSDGNSINVQRFQNVLFNIVFGIIFLQKSVVNNVLPDFDDNILLLMGISSGAYAGLKFTEGLKAQPVVSTDPPGSAPGVNPLTGDSNLVGQGDANAAVAGGNTTIPADPGADTDAPADGQGGQPPMS